MRTQGEIVERVRASRTMFGFQAEVLVPHLDFEHAREFLKPEMTLEKWEEGEDPSPLTEARAVEDFRKYAEFAWGKARDHRGLSASRSVEKLSTWTWLLGRDDVLEAVEAVGYAQYGCPKLKVICDAFGFPVPDDEATQRMIRGEPCEPGCESGCG